MSLPKVIAGKLLVTDHDLKWPRGCEKGHWSQFSDSGVKSTCKPMFESVLNGFRPKEAPFNFLPLP